MKHSIRRQMAGVFIGIMAVTFFLCWLANHFFLEDYYFKDKKKALVSAFEVLNKGVSQGQLSDENFTTRMQLIWHITIPSILPTYTVLLMLSISNFLSNGMEQYFVFQNSFNKEAIQVLDLYVYNLAMGSGSYSVSTALSMLKSVVSIVLLCVANKLAKLVRGESFM